MSKINIVVLIIGLLFLGCASKQKVVVSKKEAPSWLIHPPKSNNFELFALGEGENKQDALNNALTFMVSTLSVSVSSSFSAKTVVKEGSINSSDATYVNQTQSDVKRIRISDYEILHEEKLGFKKYVVLIKANKKKLFQGLKNEIDQKFEIYENNEKNIQNSNALKQLSSYKKMIKTFAYIKNSLIVMKVLNENFNQKKYLEKMNSINKKYQYLLQNISFWVYSNVESLSKPIIAGLTKQKFIVKKSKSKMHFNIYIKAKIKKANAYGFTLARSEVSFTTKDYANRVLASNVVHIVGQSSQGYAIAKQNLVKRLNALVKKEGIAKMLNINI